MAMAMAGFLLFIAVSAVAVLGRAEKVGYGYRLLKETVVVDHNGTFHAMLQLRNPTNKYGPDISKLHITVRYETKHRLHVHIQDADKPRWQIPDNLIHREVETHKEEGGLLRFSYSEEPFGFAITRKSTGETLFNSTPSQISPLFNELVFKDQYLEISTSLPGENAAAALFGLGESTRPSGFRLLPGAKYTLWTADIASSTPDINLYGSVPFYLDVREDGSTHGVLLLNSNGMDVLLQKDYLTFKTIGGIMDFYFFAGPSPSAVMEQFTGVVGRPAPMPYWSFGFHQCRYGYKDLKDIETVVARYKAAKIPLETMWTDIDYMDAYKDFTVDPINFPADKLRAFVNKLHANGQKYVLIIDPGIKVEKNYSTYEHGVELDIFIKQGEKGDYYLAQVWPGPVYFPDFLHPKIDQYWTSEIANFYEVVPFDGLWIDMNEASNFCSGVTCLFPTNSACPKVIGDTECCLVCSNSEATKWDNPPYKINNSYVERPLGNKTIATSAYHYGGILEYDAHNLYGFTEAIATFNALKSTLKKRPFVLSRSTFVGSGAYTAHWSGDNAASWNDLAYSIVSILNSGIAGIPMVGADICGFGGDTNEELCNRWIQLGAFYPFSRDHSDKGSIRQELYLWDSVANSARKALNLRYRLLPHLYTLMYEASVDGTPIARPLFFSFPHDHHALNVDAQFLLGPNILVSPVLHKGHTFVYAYFPEGTWYNMFDLSKWVYAPEGGMHVVLDAPMDTINVHMHQGSIVAMQETAMTTKEARQTPFTLLIAFPRDQLEWSDYAFGHLFLDDGEGIEMGLETGKSSLIQFQANKMRDSIFVSSYVSFGEFASSKGWVLQKIVFLGDWGNNTATTSSSPSIISINGNFAFSSALLSVQDNNRLELSGLHLLLGESFALHLSWH